MKIFLVSYQKRSDIFGFNYSGYYQKIKELSDEHFFLFDNLQYIITDLDAKQLSSELRPTLDKNDSLLIQEIIPNESSMEGFLPVSFWKWIKPKIFGNELNKK